MSTIILEAETRRKPFTSTRYYYTKIYVRKLVQVYGIEAVRKEFNSDFGS